MAALTPPVPSFGHFDTQWDGQDAPFVPEIVHVQPAVSLELMALAQWAALSMSRVPGSVCDWWRHSTQVPSNRLIFPPCSSCFSSVFVSTLFGKSCHKSCEYLVVTRPFIRAQSLDLSGSVNLRHLSPPLNFCGALFVHCLSMSPSVST